MASKKAKPRRTYGSGSVYESPKGSGRWVAAERINNTLVRRRATSESAAKARLGELQELKRKQIDVAKGSQLYQEWLNTWHLEKQRLGTPKPRTVEHERDLIERYIIPKLGTYRLLDLRPTTIQTFVDAVYADIRSVKRANSDEPRYDGARTTNAAAKVVEESLTLAHQRKLIADNPYSGIRLPRYHEKDITPMDDAQCLAFFRAAAGTLDMRGAYTTRNGRTKKRPKLDTRLLALWASYLLLGWRRGEGLGALWENIDWDARTIKITQQVQRLSGRDADGNPTVSLYIGTPKTRAGARVLPLTRLAFDLYRHRWDDAQAEYALKGLAWTGQGLIFCAANGAPLWPDNIETMFRRIRAAAGLPGTVRLHHLRHTLATMVDETGISTETLKAGILGHAKQSQSGKYTHARIEAMRKVLQAVEDRLFGQVSVKELVG
jgi:integrase